jgi:hypothetical protein
MEDLNLYQNLYNENYSDVRKNELIQKVFENKTKSFLSEKSETLKMAQGGDVADKVYSPYEFLHELLPKVYGRPYIVSDVVGDEYNRKIEEEEKALKEYIDSKLVEYGVNSLYRIDNKQLIEEIEIRRRKIISDKSFVTNSELEAYLFCHPELYTEHYVDKTPNYDVKDMMNNGLIMIDYNPKESNYFYVYVYEYLSGNVNEKLSRLRQYKSTLQELNVLTDEQFLKQESALMSNLPTQAQITDNIDTCLFILPSSNFGKKFTIYPEDFKELKVAYGLKFIEAFKLWTSKELDKAIIKYSENLNMIHKYFTDLSDDGKSYDLNVYSDRRKRAYQDGRVILFEFLTNALTDNCKKRLEIEWNEKYNSYTEPKYYKIPVSCHLGNKFKNAKEFIPNETQIQSLQFTKAVGSGLLAYGVGVGKTASAIMNVSFAIDNGNSKKPLFIVPNATYYKWKMEMFGGTKTIYEVEYTENNTQSFLTFEKQEKAEKFSKAVNGKVKVKTENIYGHISHLKNVVELGNLNEDIVLNLKTYTKEEKQKINEIADLIKYVKTLPSDYNFLNDEINRKITSVYDDFNVDELISEHSQIMNDEFSKWWKFTKNKERVDYNRYNGYEYFLSNVNKLSLLNYFEKGLKIYKEELPYILGELKPFDDKTVFLATYEALEHLGLVLRNNNDLRDNDSIFGKVYNEISQGDDIYDANYAVQKNNAVLLRDAVYGKKRTKIDINDLGIDYVVFDESHLLKKAIVDCKGLPTEEIRKKSGTKVREPRKYDFGSGEFPSTLALTGYFITRLIQSKNNGKNVLHLTATPFTNKPAEIYSMLSLTNREMLEESNFFYMEQFFDVFMDISFDLVFGNTGVERKEVLLGYRNLPQLRNLIYSMMDYKSGEDANIKRPEKILFPSREKGIETKIPESLEQDELFKVIKDYQRGEIEYSDLCSASVEELDIDEYTEDELITFINEHGTDVQKEKYNSIEKPLEEDEFLQLKEVAKKIAEKLNSLSENNITDQEGKDVFRVIKGISLLKAVTLSPYLSSCQKQANIEPTYTEYVESSPKLIYTIKCIQSIHNYELENNLVRSGCVIYMNLGVNVSFKDADGNLFKWKENGFDKIKQYLINKLGYSSDEISIVSGSLSNIEKEKAKNKFLSGKSTILIGSSAISTGVDLQNNASALFNCTFDWNPTDNEQLSGRIHRQGNRFAKIRIVYPMVMNSADPSIFQQLYEKTQRIKNIWDRNDRGNTLDLKDFDVNSLRKGILDEPKDLVTYWFEEQNEEITSEFNLLNRRKEDVLEGKLNKETLDLLTPVMKGIIVVLDAYKKLNRKKEDVERMNEKIGEAQSEYDNKLEELQQKLDKDDDFAPKYGIEIKKAKQKLEKAKESAKEDIYDFENDPEGRYKILTYDEIGDGEELLKQVDKWISNSDSYFRDEKKISLSELNNIQYTWLEEYFPRFKNGYYDLSKSEQDDRYIWVQYHQKENPQSPISLANKWKNAFRDFKKVRENLKLLGVAFEDIDETVRMINQRQEGLTAKQQLLIEQKPEKLKEFILAKEERLVVQPTIEERVNEFASWNYILKETVPTFAEDRSKFVEIPKEKLPIKPSKKEIEKEIEKKIEEAVIQEEVIEETKNAGVDTNDLISNLKNGMIVRFNKGSIKKGETLFVDIFYEDGEYVKYKAWENEDGEIIRDTEKNISESEAVKFYIDNHDKISEEFFDNEVEEEEITPIKATEEVSKSKVYNDLIEGYQLALEIESDEEKIKLYNDLIERYPNKNILIYTSLTL